METMTNASTAELQPMPPSPEEQEEYYKSDEFRMSSMKVVQCNKRYVHDWTECPFAHPQEKATRRDLQSHSYTGIACPAMKKEGICSFGDHCPYAHNVFEYWLHPTRYRTQLCNDGLNCRRKICFFAHSLDELRVPSSKPFVSPEALAAAATAATAADSEGEAPRRGIVGSPVANLDIPPCIQRASMDSIRQSLDWGPVPMPKNTASASITTESTGSGELSPLTEEKSTTKVLPEASHDGNDRPDIDTPCIDTTTTTAATTEAAATVAPENGSNLFSAEEHHVIEAVTCMLAEDKISPPQAATLLQHLLPPQSLQLLQSRLGFPTLGTQQQRQQHWSSQQCLSSLDPTAAVPSSSPSSFLASIAPPRAPPSPFTDTRYASPADATVMQRVSLESDRSSFDVTRMSLDSRISTEYTPRGSIESLVSRGPHGSMNLYGSQYAVPLPAYPQYWTGMPNNASNPFVVPTTMPMPLSSVPEGMPLTVSGKMLAMEDARQGYEFGGGNKNASGGDVGATYSAAAARLSSDLSRLSVDAHNGEGTGVRGVGSPLAPTVVNPFASSFFAGGGMQ